MPHENRYYNELIKRLLYVESIDDIRLTLQSIQDPNYEILFQEIQALEADYIQKGNEAQLCLLTFVKNVIYDIFRERNGSDISSNKISTPEELSLKIFHAPNVKSAYNLLLKHRPLIIPKLYYDLEERFVNRDPLDYSNTIKWEKLLYLVSLLVEDKAVTAKGQMFWAAHNCSLGRYDVAERYFNNALKTAEKLKDVPFSINAEVGLANLYVKLRNFDRAIYHYERALEAAEYSKDDSRIYGILRELSRCYNSVGKYSAALELIDKSLTVRWTNFPKLEVQDRLFKGLILENLCLYIEGQAEYEHAEQLAEELNDRRGQFEAMTSVAASFIKQNRLSEAVNRYEIILSIVKKWGDPLKICSTHNNLGTALMIDHRPAEALEEYFEALTLRVHSGQQNSEAVSFLGIGNALKELGNFDDAKTWHKMMLIPYLKTGDLSIITMFASNAHYQINEIDQDSVNLIIEARDFTKTAGLIAYELMLAHFLVSYYLAHNDEDTAEAICKEVIEHGIICDPTSIILMSLELEYIKLLEDRSKSYQEIYNLLIYTLNIVNQHLHKELIDKQRGEIISKSIDLYGALIKLLLEHGNEISLSSAFEADELAFNLHDSIKSRTFLSSLAKMEIAQPESIPLYLRNRENHLLSLERSLQGNKSTGKVISGQYQQKRLQEIIQELQKCWNEMKPYAPEYVQMRIGEPATFQELNSLFSNYEGPVMAYLSFFSDDKSTIYFVVRSDERRLHVFNSKISRETLNEVALHLRSTFNGSSEAFPPIPPIRRDHPWDRDLKPFEDLSNELLKFLPIVQGVELLCVLPHGPLHHIPIHALKAPDGKYLIENFAFVYCPSLSTLKYILTKQNCVTHADKRPSVYIAGVAAKQDTSPEFFEQDCQIFDKEIWDIKADLGIAASKERVLQQLDKCEIIHLACHGYFNESNYLNSGLMFSDGQERPTRDLQSIPIIERNKNVVTVYDILRIKMHASVVTLRACSTGIQGQCNLGDEFEGLSRALIYSGSTAVVISLWNVDQQSSLKLLTNFYRNLIEIKKPTEKWRAMWMAQKYLLTSSDEKFLSHPYHWAPFIIIGDWR